MWNIQKSIERDENDDEDDLIVVLFNTVFQIIILISSLGKVEVYGAETGVLIKEFSTLFLDPTTRTPVPLKRDFKGYIIPQISYAYFDIHERYLIIVNLIGEFTTWDFHTGDVINQRQCLLRDNILLEHSNTIAIVDDDDIDSEDKDTDENDENMTHFYREHHEKIEKKYIENVGSDDTDSGVNNSSHISFKRPKVQQMISIGPNFKNRDGLSKILKEANVKKEKKKSEITCMSCINIVKRNDKNLDKFYHHNQKDNDQNMIVYKNNSDRYVISGKCILNIFIIVYNDSRYCIS